MSTSDRTSEPPKIGRDLLKVIFASSIYDEVYGDLHELYQGRLEEKGKRYANRHFYKDIFLSIRNFKLRRQKSKYSKTPLAMYKNYWKISFRNIFKNKIYSALNIAGLAIGLVSCFFILQYVKHEKGYDQFHENIDNLYRVQYNQFKNGEQLIACAAAVPRVGPFMKENMPEVVDFARAFPMSGVISFEDINFRQSRIQIVDPSFLKIMSFPLLSGNPETALVKPNTAVISSSTSKKFFGSEDPIGKVIDMDGDRKLEITGVAKDVPANSHLRFELLISYQTLNNETDNGSEESWGWYDFNTYVLLKDGTDPKAYDKKFDAIYFEERKEDFEKYNFRSEFPLQAVADIHLYSDLLQESEPTEQGDGDAVLFLSILALFILIIAWINYINLSTARSIERAKEVGIRKVIGANKPQLITQFIIESLIVNFIAFALASVLIIPLHPYFNQLAGIDIGLAIFTESAFWQSSIALFLVGSILSGLYPAFVLSNFKPVTVLKSKAKGGGVDRILRKILVVFQFAASVGLIIGTIIVFQQLQFMQNMDNGFDMNKTLVVKGPGVFDVDSLRGETIDTYKTEMMRSPQITSFSASSNVPGNEIFWTRGVRKASDNQDANKIMYMAAVDQQYFDLYNIEVIAGRNFDLAFGLDTGNVILNHKAISYLGFNSADEALNQVIKIGGNSNLTIVGIVDDFNQMSAKIAVAPIAFQLQRGGASYFTYKLGNENFADALSEIQTSFERFFPGNPFDYYFLEEFFNAQYTKDKQFSIVFITFTLLAIFVACLGLFGLSSLSTLQRSKEIGIRKSLGASIQNVVYLLSREFLLLVVIANVFAWPLTYYFMNKWLEGFAQRISIHWTLFFFGAIMVGLIAFATVAYKTIKTARSNPINALRYQ